MATLECAETRSGRLHAALACQSTCAQSSGVNALCASTQGKARTLRLRSKSKHPRGSTTSESLGALVPHYEICIPQGSNVDTSAGSSAGLVSNEDGGHPGSLRPRTRSGHPQRPIRSASPETLALSNPNHRACTLQCNRDDAASGPIAAANAPGLVSNQEGGHKSRQPKQRPCKQRSLALRA